MNIKIKKITQNNPKTHVLGYAVRVLTNGVKNFVDMAVDASRNTTIHPAEAKLAVDLFCEEAARRLKEGFIVDLGPLGKLYPSCTSGWAATAEGLTKDDVKTKIIYRASDELEAAVRSATLTWVGVSDSEGEMELESNH